MSWLMAFLAALVAYPVAALLARLVLSLATMPLMNVQALVRSRACLGVLRLVVGGGCGAGGLVAGLRLMASLDGGPALLLAAGVVALVAAFHIWGAWPFRGTSQFADDMLSLAGEELGVVGLAAWLFVR